MPWPVGMPIGPQVHGVGVIAPFGWNWAMPRDVAVQVSQRDAFSPRLPYQCQPLAGVYQAIQPRVDTVVGWTVVKSGSARNACAAPAVVHCLWPSVQKPAGRTEPPGSAAGVPAGTNAGAVPGDAGRLAPLPGGGPGRSMAAAPDGNAAPSARTPSTEDAAALHRIFTP